MLDRSAPLLVRSRSDDASLSWLELVRSRTLRGDSISRRRARESSAPHTTSFSGIDGVVGRRCDTEPTEPTERTLAVLPRRCGVRFRRASSSGVTDGRQISGMVLGVVSEDLRSVYDRDEPSSRASGVRTWLSVRDRPVDGGTAMDGVPAVTALAAAVSGGGGGGGD